MRKTTLMTIMLAVSLATSATTTELNGDGRRQSVRERFDLNDDKQVDVGDVNLLLDYILDPSAFNDEPQVESKTYTVNGVTFKMVAVAGGTFTMGATSEQGSDAYNNENKAHQVTLSDYWIGETEVTEALWTAVMGSNPSYYTQGGNCPVEYVSWDDCQTFITKLNSLTGETFRLPTEAEWEFAARGGTKSEGYKYSGSNTIGDVAWYTVNAYDVGSSSPNYGKHPVATKAANELGLYDMSGNVWEWCQDRYGSYSGAAQTDPTGPTTGSSRVSRGGSWIDGAELCVVSIRRHDSPSYRYGRLGLRLAR